MAAEIFGAGVQRDVGTVGDPAGIPSGVAQVLSISTSAPCACAAAAIAGTSWTSNESDPGDSTNTTLVAGRISRSMPPPINGS
jgi:hypothetical protein